jgi:hypothetical protein
VLVWGADELDDLHGPAAQRAVAIAHNDMMPQVSIAPSALAGRNVTPG